MARVAADEASLFARDVRGLPLLRADAVCGRLVDYVAARHAGLGRLPILAPGTRPFRLVTALRWSDPQPLPLATPSDHSLMVAALDLQHSRLRLLFGRRGNGARPGAGSAGSARLVSAARGYSRASGPA